MPISAIFLAAGTSSRMGKQNKLLLPFRGKPMVQYCYEQLPSYLFDEIIIVTGFEAHQIQTALSLNKKARFVYNPDYENGMTSSIQTGVQNLAAPQNAVLICLGDMPFLRPNTYTFLCKHFNENYKGEPLIQVPVYENGRGNPVLFSAHFIAEIIHHKESNGCKAIVQKHQSDVLFVQMSKSTNGNDIDDPASYQLAIQ